MNKGKKQMKKIVRGLLVAVIMLMAIGCGSTSGNNETSTNATKGTENATESADNDTKTLIVYYSYSGTTKRVAEHLQQLTDGTLYEITLDEPYSGDSNKDKGTITWINVSLKYEKSLVKNVNTGYNVL